MLRKKIAFKRYEAGFFVLAFYATLGVIAASSWAGEDPYARERAVLQRSLRDYARTSEVWIQALERGHRSTLAAKLALEHLEQQVRLLEEAGSPSRAAEAPPAELEAQFKDLVAEKIRVLSLLRELESRQAFLGSSLAAAEEALKAAPSGGFILGTVRSETESALASLKARAVQRLEDVEARLGAWRVAVAAEEAFATESADEQALAAREVELGVAQWLDRVGVLKFAVLRELRERKVDSAALSLEALEWFLAGSKIFFDSQKLTLAQRQVLAAQEREVLAQIARYRPWLEQLRQQPRDAGLRPLDVNVERPSETAPEDFIDSEEYQETKDEAMNADPGSSSYESSFERVAETVDGREVRIWEESGYTKSVCEYNAETGFNESRVDLHFGIARVEGHQVQETREVPGSVEFGFAQREQADRTLVDSFRFEATEVDREQCPQPERQEVEKADRAERFSEQVAGLLDRADRHASSDRDRKHLKELRSLADRLKTLQQRFNHLAGAYGQRIGAHASAILETVRQWNRESLFGRPLPNPRSDQDAASAGRRNAKTRTSLISQSLGLAPSAQASLLDRFLERLGEMGSAKEQVLSERARNPKRPPGVSAPQHSGKVMTLELRTRLLDVARVVTGQKIRYSQAQGARLGPNSYDCSGFVGKMYEKVGLGFVGPSGEYLNVDGILRSDAFQEVRLSEAQPGDLVIHEKGRGGASWNHVGIYARTEADKVFEVSALSRDGSAMLDPDEYPERFKTSVVEHPTSWIGSEFRIFSWKNRSNR